MQCFHEGVVAEDELGQKNSFTVFFFGIFDTIKSFGRKSLCCDSKVEKILFCCINFGQGDSATSAVGGSGVVFILFFWSEIDNNIILWTGSIVFSTTMVDDYSTIVAEVDIV